MSLLCRLLQARMVDHPAPGGALHRRVPACVAWVLAAALGWGFGLGFAFAQEGDQLALGKRIYREGLLDAGKVLTGQAVAGVELSGKDAACTTCHRRSGYGSSEGSIEVRSITGPALFGRTPGADAPINPQTAFDPSARGQAQTAARALRAVRLATLAGGRQRPVYDESTLARAIQQGIDVTGKPMNASMPRYTLEPAQMQALTAYLKTLSVQAASGVTDTEVHFATVFQPGTPLAHRQALLQVIQTYFQERNAGLRAQVRRQEAGSVRLRRSYRNWILHAWDLTGPSDTWPGQLEAFNRQQAVFALVSGLGQESWRPIHDFSERFEVPCIFPQVDLPVLDEGNHFTVYLSRGVTLEAQALASFLQRENKPAPLVQVYHRDTAGASGARAFSQAWQAYTGSAPEERVIDGLPDASFWSTLARQRATLVLWLNAQDLGDTHALTAPETSLQAIYLPLSLNRGTRSGLAAHGSPLVRMIYPEELPLVRDARLELVRRWMHDAGIEPSNPSLQMNAYLAATVTAMVVSHSMDTYSADYLMERMEHMLGNALERSIYPRLSLGPGQRFASKGSYIVTVGGKEDSQLMPLSDWIVP